MPSFSEYYWAGRRGHLIGVGGVSMSPLAEVLAEAGLVITGSDMNEGANVAHLRALGIPVFIGHRAENIVDAERFVRGLRYSSKQHVFSLLIVNFIEIYRSFLYRIRP